MKLFLLLLVVLSPFTTAAILGIDFGHEFTKAALVAPGVPFEIVMSADSKRKDISGVAFKPLGNDEFERLYGSQTTAFCTRYPQQCLLNLKPLLGKSPDHQSAQHYLQSHAGVRIVPSKNNRNTIAFDISGTVYPIEEVAAMNIQNIASRASALLKEKSPGGYSQIRDVAVTVPSFFSTAQRNALMDVIELSGFNLVSLVDDGLAIAVNYATSREFQQGRPEYHIIYDMGAGSTKATLVSFFKMNDTTPVSVNVESYAYDETLGGSYFTNAVAEIVMGKFLEKHPDIHTSSFLSTHRAVAKLYQVSDKAKLVLSANSEAHVSIESLYNDIDFKTKITREEFEDYLSDCSTRISQPILEVLDKAHLSLRDLTSVMYAGGSTRVPFVQRQVLSLVGEELVSKTINADEAAVLGAALRGVQISKMFRSKELNVTEPSPFGYKISVSGGKAFDLFPMGTPYGASVSLNLTEHISGSGDLEIDIFEDSQRYMTYDAGNLNDIEPYFKFNSSDCVGGVVYAAKFSLTHSRLVSLDSIEAQCSVFKITDRTKNADEKASDESLKIKKYAIHTKTRYIGPRPLGTATKQELKNHLASLDFKDKQRKLISEKLNELESSLYSARTFLDDDEVLEKCPKDMVEKASSFVTQYLEWLDNESDGAQIKDIRSKLDDLQGVVKGIVDYIEQLSTPLDAAEFERIHHEAVLGVNNLQEAFLNMGEELLSLSFEFAEAGANFEKETEKLPESAITEDDIEDLKRNVSLTFDKVKKLYEDEKELEKTSREEKFALRSEALQRLQEMGDLQRALYSAHTQKMKDLKSALSKFQRAQKRAEAKRRAADSSHTASETKNSADEHDEL